MGKELLLTSSYRWENQSLENCDNIKLWSSRARREAQLQSHGSVLSQSLLLIFIHSPKLKKCNEHSLDKSYRFKLLTFFSSFPSLPSFLSLSVDCFKVSPRQHILYPQILHLASSKNEDILLQKHTTIIQPKVIIINFLVLSHIQLILRFPELFSKWFLYYIFKHG